MLKFQLLENIETDDPQIINPQRTHIIKYCKGITTKNKQCKNKVQNDSNYCYLHIKHPQRAHIEETPITSLYDPQRNMKTHIKYKPTTSSYRRPTTSSYRRPTTSSYRRPTTSSYRRPTTSSYILKKLKSMITVKDIIDLNVDKNNIYVIL